MPVNQSIYDALTVLQHRGQDAAGIITIDGHRFRLRKANGLVNDILKPPHAAFAGQHGDRITCATLPQAAPSASERNLTLTAVAARVGP